MPMVSTAAMSALAEPNRLHIVELLKDGPRAVGDIADQLHLNQPQTSKHLRVLCDAGLTEVHAVANRRIYKLRPQQFQEMDRWLDSYRKLWEERFDRLDEYLRVLQAQKPDDEGSQNKT
jgi:DNA-binding transcriptional ArsR family regulator